MNKQRKLKVIPLHKDQQALLKKALANSREAQHQLYEMYAPKMLSVCRQYINDIYHAEDVMIMGFTKVFKHLKTYKSEGSFEGWIRRIMVREAISFLRTQKKFTFYTDQISKVNSALVMPEVNLEVNDIQQLIDELPEGYRVVFLMYAVEGYKHHEIAETLHISEGTSKSQLFKARKMLQQKIVLLKEKEHGTK